MCLDADGQIWFANALTRQCVRVAEGGEVTGTVTCSQRAFACMLGGGDGRTLYVMTAGSSDRFEVADKTEGVSKRSASTSRVPAPVRGIR